MPRLMLNLQDVFNCCMQMENRELKWIKNFVVVTPFSTLAIAILQHTRIPHQKQWKLGYNRLKRITYNHFSFFNGENRYFKNLINLYNDIYGTPFVRGKTSRLLSTSSATHVFKFMTEAIRNLILIFYGCNLQPKLFILLISQPDENLKLLKWQYRFSSITVYTIYRKRNKRFPDHCKVLFRLRQRNTITFLA